jgi:glyoxylase-like metal-dependent hydrolase (beta-lactamase superfamily II)
MPSLAGFRPYTLEIVPGLFQISVSYNNVFLVVEQNLTLIDTGFRNCIPHITGLIHKLGRSPEEIKLVVLSHNHIDHTGGLSELKKLAKFTVAAHRADVCIQEDVVQYFPGNIAGMILKIPGLALLRHRLVLDTSNVDTIMDGGEVFDIMGGMRVIYTPGHTYGSISLYFPAHKLLLAGDALGKRGGELWLPRKSVSTDMQQAAESIKAISKLDVDILCTGHGYPHTKNAHEKMQTLVNQIKT